MLRLSEIKAVEAFDRNMRNAGVPERQACFGRPGVIREHMERDYVYRDKILSEMSEAQQKISLRQEIGSLIDTYVDSKTS